MERTDRRFFNFAAIALLLSSPACQGGRDDVMFDEQGHEIVATGSPVTGPASTADLAPLPQARASFPTASGISGAYTDGRDLVAAPLGGTSLLDETAVRSATTSWKSQLIGTSVMTPPKLGNYLDLALADSASKTDKAKLDDGVVGPLFQLISLLGGGTPTTSKGYSFNGYAPLRGRWLNGQRVSTINGSVWQTYADPTAMGELRERGARLYCAARQAQAIQGSNVQIMGEEVGFSTSILGKKIDFMVIEPTVVFDGPTRYTDIATAPTNPNLPYISLPDGAQSFNLPMQFGTRITPIRGLGIPGLPEMRYPVALTMADSEVRTSALLQAGAYNKKYITATHGDAIASAWENINAHASVLLFSTGLVRVDLGLTLDFDLGKPRTNGGTAVKQTRFDERVLHPQYLPSYRYGFPGTPGFLGTFELPLRARSGIYTTNYDGYGWHDGAWTPPAPCTIAEFHPCPTWIWQVLGGSGPAFTPASIGPLDIRAWQDDDHYVETRTALTLGGTLKGTAGFDSIGPFRLSFTVEGGLTGTVGQAHMIRDMLNAEYVPGLGFRAATGLTVRPRTDASAWLNDTKGTLHLSIDLGWFGTVQWDPELFSIKGTTIAEYDSENTHAWKESASLRIGTSSSKGDPMKKPDVHSHLPNGPAFASFPQDVDSCLADNTPNPSTPPKCDARPTEGWVPHGYVCAYAQLPGNFTGDPCLDIPGTLTRMGLGSEATKCWNYYLKFLCGGGHKIGGSPSITHVIDGGSRALIEAQMLDLGKVQNLCVNMFVPQTGNQSIDHANAKKFMDSFFKLALCKSDGTIYAPTDIIGAWDVPTTPPPVSPPAACH